MDLRDRVDDILEGRIKLGAGLGLRTNKAPAIQTGLNEVFNTGQATRPKGAGKKRKPKSGKKGAGTPNQSRWNDYLKAWKIEHANEWKTHKEAQKKAGAAWKKVRAAEKALEKAARTKMTPAQKKAARAAKPKVKMQPGVKKWQKFLFEWRKAHPEVPYKTALKKAGAEWKKVKPAPKKAPKKAVKKAPKKAAPKKRPKKAPPKKAPGRPDRPKGPAPQPPGPQDQWFGQQTAPRFKSRPDSNPKPFVPPPVTQDLPQPGVIRPKGKEEEDMDLMKRLQGNGMFSGGAKSRNSSWISFVKDYARVNNVSYRDALSLAGPEYRASKK